MRIVGGCQWIVNYHRCWEPNLDPLLEWNRLLTIEPSLQQPHYSPFYTSRQGLSLNTEIPNCSGMTCQPALRNICFLHAGIIGGLPIHTTFMWVPGIWTLVFTLAQQTLELAELLCPRNALVLPRPHHQPEAPTLTEWEWPSKDCSRSHWAVIAWKAGARLFRRTPSHPQLNPTHSNFPCPLHSTCILLPPF